jgi:hypothetical protein
MRVPAIEKALAEGSEFRKLAQELLDTTKSRDGDTWIDTGKLSGAVKRKSMDLTRALAEMRKP